jgi:hypothetical protein
MNDAYINVGDRVVIGERWRTTTTNRNVGTVRRVFRSQIGGTWAEVLFDGDRQDSTCMVRELEPADETQTLSGTR